jgi:hypothetical protein
MNSIREVRGVDDTPMPATYVSVMILEAAIIVALWLFGRAFA